MGASRGAWHDGAKPRIKKSRVRPKGGGVLGALHGDLCFIGNDQWVGQAWDSPLETWPHVCQGMHAGQPAVSAMVKLRVNGRIREIMAEPAR